MTAAYGRLPRPNLPQPSLGLLGRHLWFTRDSPPLFPVRELPVRETLNYGLLGLGYNLHKQPSGGGWVPDTAPPGHAARLPSPPVVVWAAWQRLGYRLVKVALAMKLARG